MSTVAADPVSRLPAGFTVRIRPDVRRHGDLLVGGSPLRAIRLSRAARSRMCGDVLTVSDEGSQVLAALLLDRNVADPVLEGPPVSAELITVVIPVLDRAEQLDRALAGIAPLRAVVVDDGSSRAEAVAEVADRHGAMLVRREVNGGPAAARNAGLAAVRTPYVAFVDSDITVDAMTLRRLARHFDDERVALVGPMVRSRSRSAAPRWQERYDEATSSLTLGNRPCSVRPGAAVGWLPSACLIGRTAELGSGFDDSMRVGEDVDLVWRLVAQGLVVRYDPSETAHHDTRTTVRGWLGRKFVYGTGGALLADRHGDAMSPAVLSPAMALSAAALLARRRWSAPVAAAGTTYTAVMLRRRLPNCPGRTRLAASLAVEGLGWAVRQESALAVRHWWPVAAVLLPGRTARRMVMSALVVDTIVGCREHPDAPYLLFGRRLDDIAYGGGLWYGALRRWSLRCLAPRRPR